MISHKSVWTLLQTSLCKSNHAQIYKWRDMNSISTSTGLGSVNISKKDPTEDKCIDQHINTSYKQMTWITIPRNTGKSQGYPLLLCLVPLCHPVWPQNPKLHLPYKIPVLKTERPLYGCTVILVYIANQFSLSNYSIHSCAFKMAVFV